MKWEDGRRSDNVDDRRSQGGPQRGGRRGGGVKMGAGTIVVALVLYFGLGVDPSFLLGGGGSGGSAPTTQSPQKRSAAENKLADFTTVVLADLEDTWHVLFKQQGKTYREPTLVLFTNTVRSACGVQGAQTGPFYCPPGQKIYIDLGFFNELSRRFGAPGDFAQAYVIAHEVGHHVQNLLGTSEQVHRKQQRVSKIEANKLSVRLELQADCYSGIWAHHAKKSRNLLEKGDIEEGLRAAQAIGDDALQKQAQGYVVKESFTHGSSKQRMHWFSVGFKTGKMNACDTFSSGI